MARTLKVYGWQSFRRECDPAPNGSRQTREICAAHSMAEVARIAGVNRPQQLFNLGETGNKEELAAATASPGTIFWRPLNAHSGHEFRRAGSEREKQT